MTNPARYQARTEFQGAVRRHRREANTPVRPGRAVIRTAASRDARPARVYPFTDGAWHESGGMGWWGIVANEKEADMWAAEFTAMLDALPDNAVLTIVDCHN
jgi:hypothetical protein